MLSWLWVGDGDPKAVGDAVGETLLGDWIADSWLTLRHVGLSDSLLVPEEFFRDFGLVKRYFCLNRSNQDVLRTRDLPSVKPQVLAKNSAFSRIASSVRLNPWRW